MSDNSSNTQRSTIITFGERSVLLAHYHGSNSAFVRIPYEYECLFVAPAHVNGLGEECKDTVHLDGRRFVFSCVRDATRFAFEFAKRASGIGDLETAPRFHCE